MLACGGAEGRKQFRLRLRFRPAVVGCRARQDTRLCSAALRNMATRFPGRGWGRLSRALRLATHPAPSAPWYRGREDFEFPGTADLLGPSSPSRPTSSTVTICMAATSICGSLRRLSQRVPAVLTLHDSWLLTGHCAHSFECERWKTGCGACPDLTIEPCGEARRHGRELAAEARRLRATAGSTWPARHAGCSIGPGSRCWRPQFGVRRVIPNGIDVSVFQPASSDRRARGLGLPGDAFVVLLAGSGQGSAWRDTSMLRRGASRGSPDG